MWVHHPFIVVSIAILLIVAIIRLDFHFARSQLRGKIRRILCSREALKAEQWHSRFSRLPAHLREREWHVLEIVAALMGCLPGQLRPEDTFGKELFGDSDDYERLLMLLALDDLIYMGREKVKQKEFLPFHTLAELTEQIFGDSLN